MIQLKNRVQGTTNQSIQFTEFFRPYVYKPILIGVTIMVLQQFSGFVCALFYTGYCFNAYLVKKYIND